MEKTKLYLAQYNPMIHESAFYTLSVHKTKRGAEMAISFHKEELRKEFEKDKVELNYGRDIKFGQFENWNVKEIDLDE